MLKKLLSHKRRIVWIMLFVVGLILIRAFEDLLFYDPFLNYFKLDYHNLSLPELDYLKFFFGLLFRYLGNALFSLSIIYVVFKDFELTKFASLLYILFFIILVGALFFVLSQGDQVNKMNLFYIRRFLIQPLFLLLFIPAFFYQKQK